MATATIDKRVCGSCISAMKEELSDSGVPAKEAKRMAIMMGGDTPDHECTIAQKGKVCGCGCNR